MFVKRTARVSNQRLVLADFQRPTQEEKKALKSDSFARLHQVMAPIVAPERRVPGGFKKYFLRFGTTRSLSPQKE